MAAEGHRETIGSRRSFYIGLWIMVRVSCPDQGTDEREQPVATARSGDLPTTAAIPALSERERQIIDGLIKGESNKTIARAFGIAEATVKVHMKAILRKVPCSNRTQVAIWALGHTDVFRAPWMNGASVALSLGLTK